jgi:hypothetical protein
MWFEATFVLSMLEPWEKLLVCEYHPTYSMNPILRQSFASEPVRFPGRIHFYEHVQIPPSPHRIFGEKSSVLLLRRRKT